MPSNRSPDAQASGRPAVLAVRYSTIPAVLRAERRWVCWKYVLNDKTKWVKTPVNARSLGNAQSSNPATWCDYDTAFDAAFFDREIAGLGFMLGDGWVGIDVDDCYAAGAFSATASDILGTVPGYAELSPSGNGVKIFLRGTAPQSSADHARGIELYDSGRFFTVTGYAVPERDNAIVAHVDLSAFYTRYFGAHARVNGHANGYDPLESAKPPLKDWPLERVRDEVLAHLSADCHYQEWLEIGMALHHQGESDDDWLQLWIEHSESAPERYTEGVCDEKWETFSERRQQGRGGVTLATLIKRVKDVRAAEKYEATTHWRAQIDAAADRPTLLESLPKLIAADAAIDAMMREELSVALQARIRTVTGTKHPIAAIRTMLTPVVALDQHRAPEWVKEHTYVTVGDTFFNKTSKTELTRASFNAIYDRYMPKDDFGMPSIHAADAAIGMWGLEIVNRIDYHPQLGERYSFEGVEFVNRYNPSTVPVDLPVLTDDEEAAVALVRAHLAHLFDEPREQALIESWLAYNVQNPGVKVRWAPYICGPEGDGKSFLIELLAQAMGSANVHTLPGSIFEKSQFSDWAIGQCVSGIEEMKLHGHNKFDAANALKPYITNDTIPVHPKGKAVYNAINTTNYAILSNYMDGVPVTDADRRYCFFKTRFSVRSIAAFKEAQPGYYEALFDAARNYPSAMRYWLSRFDTFHPDFVPNGNAPITMMRSIVIQMSESDIDSACQQVVTEGFPGVTGSWVASACFVAAVERILGPDNRVSKQKLSGIVTQFLLSNGFVYMGDERHRFQQGKWRSRIWKAASVPHPGPEWWGVVQLALEDSFVDSERNSFLD